MITNVGKDIEQLGLGDPLVGVQPHTIGLEDSLV